MTDGTLNAKERAALLALMAEAREVPNSELKKIVGFALVGKERLRLQQRGLVVSEKKGRSFAHELTDRGWRWCEEELTAERPPRASSLGGACYALLANLARFLNRADLRLADVFGRTDEPLHVTPEALPAASNVVSDGDVESRIRAAYRQLAREPHAWVRLAELRPLVGAAREEVDTVLRQLNRSHQASIIPEQNQRILSQDDEEAAVHIAGENKHLISIE
jgi:hypothetical protein